MDSIALSRMSTDAQINLISKMDDDNEKNDKENDENDNENINEIKNLEL
jgi:hypothetical protein